MLKRTVTRAAVGLALALLAGGCQPGLRHAGGFPPREPIRALWVTRWDYKSAADIGVIMENCRRAGFNTVLFQVRGHGTAFYRSRLEPWSEELGGRDPGFDPLAVACKEAHRRGLKLHAWVNVLPGWRGKQPPADPRQLYNAHADWFWRDAQGRRQPLGWYNSLNPCYPEVRGYLVAVMREIVAGYPVDGLHLDYIRFPNEWNASYPAGVSVPDYPRDPRTLALFRQASGATPEQAPGKWNEWRAAQVTQVVRDIRAMMRRVKPGASLSAAVGADPDVALRAHFQDSRRWITEGLLDAVMPMNYAADMTVFSRRVQLWSAYSGRTRVVQGLNLEGRPPATVNQQIAVVVRSTRHFALFAYNLLFERLDARGRPATGADSAARTAQRQQVLPYIQRLAGQRG